jgi:hypothetical protein
VHGDNNSRVLHFRKGKVPLPAEKNHDQKSAVFIPHCLVYVSPFLFFISLSKQAGQIPWLNLASVWSLTYFSTWFQYMQTGKKSTELFSLDSQPIRIQISIDKPQRRHYTLHQIQVVTFNPPRVTRRFFYSQTRNLNHGSKCDGRHVYRRGRCAYHG